MFYNINTPEKAQIIIPENRGSDMKKLKSVRYRLP
jgi:hypothetical protein